MAGGENGADIFPPPLRARGDAGERLSRGRGGVSITTPRSGARIAFLLRSGSGNASREGRVFGVFPRRTLPALRARGTPPAVAYRTRVARALSDRRRGGLAVGR